VLVLSLPLLCGSVEEKFLFERLKNFMRTDPDRPITVDARTRWIAAEELEGTEGEEGEGVWARTRLD
jgi:hypothetical protein